MSSVLENLTSDEKAVLEIAYSGAPMMAIARWEKPALSLKKKGLLAGYDNFNLCVTDAGRLAMEAIGDEEDAKLGRFIEQGSRIASAQQQIAQLVQDAAALMATAAIRTAEVKGDNAEFALERWTKQMLVEAQVLIREKTR